MLLKDERLMLTNEVLNGIKVCHMFITARNYYKAKICYRTSVVFVLCPSAYHTRTVCLNG